MKKFDALIFDLDGTLLDTLEDLTDAVNFTMEHFELHTWTIDDVRSFVGNGIRRLIKLCVPGGEENEKFEEIFEFFKTYYTGHCKIKTKPYVGIEPLLDELKAAGYKLAVVSNKNDEAVKQLCADFFGEMFDVVVGERPEVNKKPAPDMVIKALEELGCEKERAVYIGDSEVDGQTAANAKMACVLVSWGFRSREVLEKFEHLAIIDDPKRFLEIL